MLTHTIVICKFLCVCAQCLFIFLKFGENVKFEFLFSLQMNDHFKLSKNLNTIYHYKYFHAMFCICNDNNRCGIGMHNIFKIIDCAYIYEN